MTTIGIDLGTTYSCVAYWNHDRAEIIPNSQGNRLTPSVVAFTTTDRLVGEAAVNQITRNSSNTIFSVKRLMGKRFSDTTVQQDLEKWPFQVIDKDGVPAIRVTCKGYTKMFSPEEISSMILANLKQTAQLFLEMDVNDAVITVPAYFNDAQRTATKTAGIIAGLNVVRILNEPTAAALAYGLNKEGKKKILVYDLGGGTFDVSILEFKNGEFSVLGVGGDPHLGGEDFDNLLMDEMIKEIAQTTGNDIRTSNKGLLRLRAACEKAKRVLAVASTATIDIDSLIDGEDFTAVITRAKFETLITPALEKTLETVKEVMHEAKVTTSDVGDVLLIGGSTRIPKVQEMLKELFEGKDPSKTVHPDEAVACGAAAFAKSIQARGSIVLPDKIVSLKLKDVIPLSLGISVDGPFMSIIIPRNTHTPVSKTKTYQTRKDNQTSIIIEVYEGERPIAEENHFLGKTILTGIPPFPAGAQQIDVTFSFDNNGILLVQAISKNNASLSCELKVTQHFYHLPEAEIQRMIAEAQRYQQEDNKRVERLRTLDTYERAIHHYISSIKKNSFKLKESERKRGLATLERHLIWLESNKDASIISLNTSRQELEKSMHDIHIV